MPNSDPKYMLVYNQLKKDLYANKYPVGSLLPTEGQLVEQFSVSKSTIRHAIAMLIADKLIRVTQGRGAEVISISAKPLQHNRYKGFNVVSFGFVPEYAGHPLTASSFLIRVIPASGTPCAELDVPVNTPLYRIQFFQMLGQITYNYITTYIPCSYVPDLDAHATEIIRLYPFIMEKYGVTFTNTLEKLTFQAADMVEARLLGIDMGAPLIHCFRSVYTGDTKFLYSEALLRADLLTMSLAADSPEYVI